MNRREIEEHSKKANVAYSTHTRPALEREVDH